MNHAVVVGGWLLVASWSAGPAGWAQEYIALNIESFDNQMLGRWPPRDALDGGIEGWFVYLVT